MVSTEEVKRDLERLKEFSLILVQILLFMVMELIKILAERGSIISKVLTSAEPWSLESVSTLMLLLVLMLAVFLLLYACYHFYSIILGEHRFFEVSLGIKMLDKAREDFREALGGTFWGILLCFTVYTILSLYQFLHPFLVLIFVVLAMILPLRWLIFHTGKLFHYNK